MRTALSGLLVAFALLAAAAPVAAQQADTARTGPFIRLDALPEGHSPEGALWRAAALPGWGQVYNGQYWKVPLVYAGLGLLGYSVVYNYTRYQLYQCAYAYVQQPDNYPACQDEADQFQTIIDTGQKELLRELRINYRRNFELSVIGTFLFYGLTIADAYISAHLLGFEVTDTLAVSAQPTPNGIRAGLRVRF